MYEKGLQTPQPLVHSTLNVAVAPRKKTARRPSRDPQRVHKITTCRKRIYIQYCNKLRIPQQRQRPASHVHFRRASGRGLGNVEEEIDSERTLSPEVKILFPLLPLVDTARSRANRIFSSEKASSRASPCTAAKFPRTSRRTAMSILTFKCKLTATAGRPVFGSISALSTGALLDARDRAVDSSTMFATGTPFATTPARLNCVLQPKGYGGTPWTVDTPGTTRLLRRCSGTCPSARSLAGSTIGTVFS